MTDHPAIAALPWTSAEGSADHQLLRTLLVRDLIHAMDSDADPETFNPADGDSGAVVPVIAFQGKLFWYDADDSTTAHDGVTTLVCTGGRRYKYDGTDFDIRSVIDKDLTDPPASPTIGDAYLVPSGASGDWASKADDIALYTSRGWTFIEAGSGQIVYVADEDGYYRWDGSAWQQGLGANALEDSSVAAGKLIGGRTHWAVENQTENTPPTVSQGTAYVIGSSPTGDWVGHTGKIAVREAAGSGDTFAIIAREIGTQIFDRALGRSFQWTGSEWLTAGGSQKIKITVFNSSGNFTKDERCVGVLVHLVGGGGGSGQAGYPTGGGTSSFGAHCWASGGFTAQSNSISSTVGSPGTGSGDAVIAALAARSLYGPGATVAAYLQGEPGLRYGGKGLGGAGVHGMAGPGGSVVHWVDDADLDAVTAVTIGAGGLTGSSGGVTGQAGIAIVFEFIEV